MTVEEQKRMTALEAENADLKEKLLLAQQTLAKYARMLFGQKTERRLPDKPEELTGSLFEVPIDPEEQARLDEALARKEAAEEKIIHVEAHDRKVGRAASTEGLEVREEHIYPELNNTDDYTEMAPEVSDRIEVIPQQVYVRRIIRHKFVLKSSLQIADPDRKPFVTAALPPSPIRRSQAGASLLADILINKYVYHLPFYRVMEKYRESGFKVAASTLNDWFEAVVGRLKPIYDLLRLGVLACDYIQVDESTLPVIDNEKHKAVKGYIWCVLNVMTGERFFYYEAGSRAARVAMGLLKDFKGAIQSDGYVVYTHFEGMEGKLLLGCWAHARRKFFEAKEENAKYANEALDYIDSLYEVEHEADEADAGLENPDYEQRRRLREKKSYDILKRFERWMEAAYPKCYEKSLIAKAIAYTYPIMKKLSLYVTDGRYRIDDNLVENAIRPLAVGRKNYLFCGNDDAAIRAGIVYSLIETCKAVGVDPRTWLEDVLSRIPEYEEKNLDYADLLPGNWKATHK